MTTTPGEVNAPPWLDLADHLPELHAALVEQRQFRLDQLRELARAARSARAVDEVRDQVDEVLRTSAMTALTEVEAALDRMRAGRYGSCERCVVQIPYERLEILPMVRYCMRCQHALEMGSGSTPARRCRRSPRQSSLGIEHGIAR